MRFFCIFGLLYLCFSGFLSAEAQEIGESGLPLPRFVSISADKSYMRTGPGRQYPIVWTYQRRGLPLTVVEEFGAWRHVVDFEGIDGWIHRQLLSSRRTAIIIGETQLLRTEPSITGKVNARLQVNVIANIEECEEKWCKLEHPQVTGWIPRAGIFGVLDGEIFD